MSNQSIEENSVKRAGNLHEESVAPGRLGVTNPAPAGHHQKTDPKLGRGKLKKK